MNPPNALTLGRIVAIPVFLLVYAAEFKGAGVVACLIFILASVTDFLDGYLARKYHLVSNFGKIMDPLADKLLVLSALIALTVDKVLPIWVVLIILARELGITSLRALAAADGIVVAASPLGKLKTVSQMLGIICLLLSWRLIGLPLIYIAVVLTVVSAIDYVRKLSRSITWW